MPILFDKYLRLSDLTDKTSAKRVFPVIVYKYTTPLTLSEAAKEICVNSGLSEGNSYNVLKDFRTLLRKTLLAGRPVNIDGLGYFYLAARSKGTDKMEDFTASDITGLRICFRANNEIRLVASGTTRTDGLMFKDIKRLQGDSAEDGGNTGGNTGGSDGDENENPLG